MKFIARLDNVRSLHGYSSVLRRHLKQTAVEMCRFLPKICDLDMNGPVPCSRRAQQSTDIDFKLRDLTGDEIFGQCRVLVDHASREIGAAQVHVGVERPLRFAQCYRPRAASTGSCVLE